MLTILNTYILSALIKFASAFPLVGFMGAFIVFALNRKSHDTQPTVRARLYTLCAVPPFLLLCAFVLIPIIAILEYNVWLTPSLFDLFYFVFSFTVGIACAVWMLRSGVQIFDTAKNKLTVQSAQERNKKTDVREIGKHTPEVALNFDPLKYMDKQKGVFLGLDEQKKPVYIEFGKGTSAPHVQVIGTTGGGKGISLGVMASQFLERGEAVFFCDPKNDEWAPSVMFNAAQRTGKPYHFINLNRPHGAQINLFEGATADEAFELFQAGFSLTEKGDISDFHGIADRHEALATARLMADRKLTIAEAYAAQEECWENAEKFYGRLREMAETPSINAKSGGVSLADVIDKGGCVYIVGSMRNDIIKTAQRILLVRLLQLAERRDRMAGELRKVCIVLDEVKYHLSRPALEGLGASRDKGVHLVLAHQSLGDLKDCTKDLNPDAVVDAVVENCRIKICYQVQSPDTAEWLAKMSGKILVDDEARSVEKNIALSEQVDNKRTIRQAERYFIDENMLRNLPPSVSVLYGAGLPKFVSIQPLKVPKSPAAVRIIEAKGTSVQTGAESLDVSNPSPFSGVPDAAAPARSTSALDPF
ncbi:MAG: type IV secretory system conjugative DNA transfer family protein [Thiothrix sp.]|uniref:type IV secretory system conjugative DNA transfer family protein n=1 Tax=Thiothrix sp. TaxID=1032 RepID=UPI002620D283|nr:type IV secretory system conjugative DNA transfer family protein [Thiothrix sp.]MDD5395484.1 type IV secretory system conjugative DNA transfer family protein [Thiothrix sp.]